MKNNILDKTILLTGATGFLGSNILKKLINKKFNNIIILKRSTSNTYRIKNILKNKKVQFFDCDIEELESIFVKNNINIIIHCACEYGRNMVSSEKVLQANLIFPIKLLHLAVKYQTDVFINTDSYFNKKNFSYSYLKDYSLSKKNFLLWLENYAKYIKIINMRLEHIFGFDDNKDKFCKFIFDKIVIENVSSIDLTLGNQKRDFIYIDDATEAYIKAIEYAFSNNFEIENFDVGTGKATTVKDFVTYIAKEYCKSKVCKLNFGNLAYREDEIMCSVADKKHLEKLKFKPQYLYKQGIDLMYKTYLKDCMK